MCPNALSDSHMTNFRLDPLPPKEKIFGLKACLCHKEGVSEKR